MNKNRAKRLNLSRETLANLEDERLHAADGGAPSRVVICCLDTHSCPPPSGGDC